MYYKLNSKILGNIGEDIATSYLVKQNYKILSRNWQCGHLEIDIIALRNDTLIFVEVKARLSSNYGDPQEAVSDTKINNLVNAADSYIYKHGYKGEIRFDIIAIMFNRSIHKYQIEHIKDAFFNC
ncbi:MAG: YraN family protein [Solitalea-like symbiont of Acarus siro]